MKSKFFGTFAVIFVLSLLFVPQAFAVSFTDVPVDSVMDEADILSAEEEAKLRESAQSITEELEISVYILTVQDYTVFGVPGDIYFTATEFYAQNDLGFGEERNGVMLMLSMSERDYAYISYGDSANEIFTDSVKIRLEDNFLDDFANNYWYYGFRDFLDDTAFQAQYGWVHNLVPFLIIVPIAFVLAIMMASGEKKRLKSVFVNNLANAYVPNGGVQMHISEDQFTHTTTSRVKISSQSSGGGGGGGRSHSGGGFSGRSGKF